MQADERLLPEILDAVDDPAAVDHDQNYRVAADSWHRDRRVLIGDAARAMHPIVGMGAALALEDAYGLAHQLGQVAPEGIEPAPHCDATASGGSNESPLFSHRRN